MQLIRATPQVMGQRMDGVYNDKGILRFESPDAFISTWQTLEAMQVDYEHCNKTDPDSPWYREYLIYDEFERKLGFFSWRNNYNVLDGQAEKADKELQLNEFDTLLSRDALISSLLSPQKCIHIGGQSYHYKDEEAVARYLGIDDSDGFEKSGGKLDVGTGDNSGKLDVGSGSHGSKLDVLGLGKGNGTSCDALLTVNVERHNANEVEFRGEQRFFSLNDGDINYSWQIYGLTGAPITRNVTLSPTVHFDEFKLTLAKGVYKVYLTVYNDVCKAYRQKKEFRVEGQKPPTSPPSSTDCCKWQQHKSHDDEYVAGKKRMKSYLGILNVAFYSSIQAETSNEEKNKRGRWKREKAAFLKIGFAGHHLLFACNGAEHPEQLADSDTNVKRVSVAKRNWQPVTIKKNKITSIHELTNSNQQAYQEIRLAQC